MPAVPTVSFDPIYQLEEAAICNEALGSISAPLILNTEETSKQASVARMLYAATRREIIREGVFRCTAVLFESPVDENFILPENSIYARAFRSDGLVEFDGVNDTSDTIEVDVLDVDAFEYLKIGMVVSGENISAESRIIEVNADTRTVKLDRTTTGPCTEFQAKIPVEAIIRVCEDQKVKFDVQGHGDNQRILSEYSGSTIMVRAAMDVIDPSLFDSLFRAALVARLSAKFAMPILSKAYLMDKMNGQYAYLVGRAKAISRRENREDRAEEYFTISSRL